MVFRARSATNSKISLMLDDVQIESVEEYKYLGSTINSCLLEKSALECLKNSFIRSVGMFMRKISSVKIGVKLSFFASLCMTFYDIDLFYEQ